MEIWCAVCVVRPRSLRGHVVALGKKTLYSPTPKHVRGMHTVFLGFRAHHRTSRPTRGLSQIRPLNNYTNFLKINNTFSVLAKKKYISCSYWTNFANTAKRTKYYLLQHNAVTLPSTVRNVLHSSCRSDSRYCKYLSIAHLSYFRLPSAKYSVLHLYSEFGDNFVGSADSPHRFRS